MKYVKPIALALWAFVVGLFALPLVVVPLALLGATWDSSGSPDSNGQRPDVIRGDLPAWARWYSSPDERLPGGTYEPALAAVLDRFGPFIASWYWLGWRNTFQGFAWQWRQRLPLPWPVPGETLETQGNLWFLRYPLGSSFVLKAGWRQYVVDGLPYGVPCLSPTRT